MFGWIKPCIYCIKITSSYMTRKKNDKEMLKINKKMCLQNMIRSILTDILAAHYY